ncbi:dienelactone hydrolase family protein [Kribbella sp. NPDC058245]|uniref:dienelactone hydrolase family protein n=1 Tax=Kribbella sp. NPDC058245 TaxID=3346399 RepID=UPI0036EB39C2
MQPGVDLVWNPPGATDLVLLAHGGYEHSHKNPGLWRGPILRMWPFAEAARTAVPSAAVGLVRYRYRGWNDVGDPALDLRAVLDELPPLIERVVLIGHSMGGRSVVAAGDHPRVAGVLGLAPWLPSDEPLIALRPPVMFAHGNNDTVTSPQETCSYANRLRAAGTPVSLVFLAGETHPMLHRPADWNTLVTTFTQQALGEGGNADGDREWPQSGAGGSMIGAVLRLALTRFRMPVRERFRIGQPSLKPHRSQP